MDEVMLDKSLGSTAPRNEPIYLDNFSTTPIAPEVAKAIIDAWSLPSNASSPHTMGARAEAIVAEARGDVANLIGAAPSEIVFTSGATEANNLILLGVAEAAVVAGINRRKIVLSSIEHKSVLVPAGTLEDRGFEVILVPAHDTGVIDMRALAAAVDDRTLLVSVMGANNETGALQPIREIVAIASKVGAYVHSDCAQLVGKLPIDVLDLGIDYLSISGHKMYGPMGIGAAFISASALKPKAIAFGGGQQAGVRPGTEPVPIIAGLGTAARLAGSRMELDAAHGTLLRNMFLDELSSLNSDVEIITQNSETLPGTVCLKVNGIIADDLIESVQRQMSISTGSACNSGQVIPSHVLMGMGFGQVVARSIFRIYFSRYNSKQDAIESAFILAKAIGHLRHPAGQPRQ
ncbi:cysteine desulfurase family protein [Asticcacaulis excentricus]|uniref:Cysteine desulfurase n=1 Tax=Asticcacaulis excentricus (strain ATCC 15261 / DSM 4724 / KCTC 12464 / NCIMB 9791 / VKM B-1370 / CB 48) TaxID=573065 RepID=E8RVZ7_ASTEC|nr:cysteine desulfurase family protein [Asticcacaulis excentricus]ADU15419.1 Cysteine desulfurase [Asticcacaulis excentricus CB 48]